MEPENSVNLFLFIQLAKQQQNEGKKKPEVSECRL